MKTPEEFLSRGTGNFINCTDYDDAVIAIRLYGKEAINERMKELALFIENQDYDFLNKGLLDFANKINDKVKQLQEND